MREGKGAWLPAAAVVLQRAGKFSKEDRYGYRLFALEDAEPVARFGFPDAFTAGAAVLYREISPEE